MKVTVWYDADTRGTMTRLDLGPAVHVRSQHWPDGRAEIELIDGQWRTRQVEQLRMAHRVSIVMEVPGG